MRARAVWAAARRGAFAGAFFAVCGLGVGTLRVALAGGGASDLPPFPVLLLGAAGYAVSLIAAGAVLNAVRARFASEFVRALAWAVAGVVGTFLVGAVMLGIDGQVLRISAIGGAFMGIIFGYAAGGSQVSDSERAQSNDGWY